MKLLSCENLCIGYKGQHLVEKLTFDLKTEDYLCVLGENGSGKSTLIKTLLHLIPPICGTLTFENGLTPDGIGYLPQETIVQKNFPASAFEVVLSGTLSPRSVSPFYTKNQKDTALSKLELLGIEDLRKRSFCELSGGQRQRVLLARALCATSKLLLLDEPISGLDPHAADEMYSAIRTANKSGITVIMVSHDLGISLKDATHVLHIARKPKFFGTVNDYVNSEVGKNFLSGGVRL